MTGGGTFCSWFSIGFAPTTGFNPGLGATTGLEPGLGAVGLGAITGLVETWTTSGGVSGFALTTGLFPIFKLLLSSLRKSPVLVLLDNNSGFAGFSNLAGFSGFVGFETAASEVLLKEISLAKLGTTGPVLTGEYAGGELSSLAANFLVGLGGGAFLNDTDDSTGCGLVGLGGAASSTGLVGCGGGVASTGRDG